MNALISKIDANARSVSELLKQKKYYIDYYQREYRWQTKHISELLNDLADKFLNEYSPEHDRAEGERYAHYFLGPIILSKKNGQTFIVDGQQRLTSLSLLLIYLNQLQQAVELTDLVVLDDYIFSEIRGQKAFNMQVPERKDAIEALYNGKSFDPVNQPESVQNIIARYNDLDDLFPDDLKNGTLLYFIDWLLYNVDLVEIVAYSDEEAYTVFETMNDRGLSLNPTDMLKGYLLSKIQDEDDKVRVNTLWKSRILELVEMGRDLDVKNEEIEACKAWLRAKYADTIRERRRGATNQDFERIGNAFHRWVRDESENLGLVKSEDFRNFVNQNFNRYTGYYKQMREASSYYTPGFESLYYNALNNFTLQYILALAPIRLDDSAGVAERKIRMVTLFIDIFSVRRMVNFRTLSYSSIQYTMFNLMKKIRDLSLPELAATLRRELDDMTTETFAGVDSFRLHGQNKRHVHYVLARMTHHIEQESGMDTNFAALVNRSGSTKTKRFEVEHIWADKFDRHTDEFSTPEAFDRYRNHFGGLILLPRGFNQSYGALPYAEKLPHYYGQNQLAKSLNPQCYEKNPSFLKYIQASGLPFQSHAQFKQADLDTRQTLYRQICEEIWNPARLDEVLP